jgi:hypothetical protein
LNSTNNDLVEAGYECMQQFLSGVQKIEESVVTV